MSDAAGATSIRYEIGNALGELNRSRPRLGAYVDANRAGPTRAAYANASARLLRAVDLFCVKYGIREPRQVGRLRIESTRKPYGITFKLEEPPTISKRTAVGAERPLELVSSRIEIGSEMGGMEGAWMLARTKRTQEWVAQDNIADAVEELFHAMDRWCDLQKVDPRHLEVDGFYARGLTYADFHFRDITPEHLRGR